VPLLDTERARARLLPLIRRHLKAEEDEATALLCRRLRAAARRGYLTASELEAACRWKSPRAIHHVRANTPKRIRAATAAALGARSEDARLQALLGLRGVSVPTASAVLTLTDPRRYGVIDIRVWQLLHARGVVTRNAPGVGLSAGNWREFLGVIRHFARTLRVRARDVERTLFDAHRARQQGRLYKMGTAKRR
jgi:hypothetical protein